MKLKRRTFAAFAAALAAVAASLTVAVPQGRSADRIKVDGSSTVAPITSAIGTVFGEYRRASGQDAAPVTVGISGTGGGFKKFCVENGTDISDASRAIKDSERALCEAAGVEFIEIKVAIDALTVAVNTGSALEQINFQQLQDMWREGSEITDWSQIEGSGMSGAIEFFRPGDDSGTFDYFTEAVLECCDSEYGVRGTNSTNRVTPSEDDNTLVEGIEGNPNAIGFFGFAYYLNNQDRVSSLKIYNDDKGEFFEPSADNVNAGNYPLSRPLFIYINKDAYETREEIRDFVDFYMALLMIDAGGTPSGVSSEITRFINGNTQSRGAQLASAGNKGFLGLVGYVSKPTAEYSLEMGCISEQFNALDDETVDLSAACMDNLSANAKPQF